MESASYRPPPELSTGRAIPGGQLLDRTGRRERVNPAGRIDPVAEEPGELLWRDSLGGLDEVVERPSAHSVPQVAFPDRSPEALFEVVVTLCLASLEAGRASHSQSASSGRGGILKSLLHSARGFRATIGYRPPLMYPAPGRRPSPAEDGHPRR